MPACLWFATASAPEWCCLCTVPCVAGLRLCWWLLLTIGAGPAVRGDGSDDEPAEVDGAVREVVYEQLRAALPFWRSFVTNPAVLEWIEHGVSLPWNRKGPVAPRASPNKPGASKHAAWLRETLHALSGKGAIQQCARSDLAVISPLDVVPKKQPGKFRLILNLRYVNANLVVTRFKYESLAMVPDVWQEGDGTVSIDLTDGYYHFAMHPSAFPYMGLEFEGRYYFFKVLPFGLSVAPFVFQKAMRELVAYWRGLGQRLLNYLDDFYHFIRLCAGQAAVRQLLRDYKRAGLSVNLPKSRLTLSDADHDWLGMGISLRGNRFFVPVERWAKLQASVAAALRSDRVQVRAIASIAGQLVSMSVALGPVAQLFTRQCHFAVVSNEHQWNRWFKTPPELREELSFWHEMPHDRFTRPIVQPVRSFALRFNVDAGAYAWGAVLELDGKEHVAHQMLRAEHVPLSSTFRELWALRQSLQSFAPLIKGKSILVLTDNQNVPRIVAKGSRQEHLQLPAVTIFREMQALGVSLHLQWIPRELNQEADAWSHFWDKDDWRVNPRVFELLDRRWGPHGCDRFASDENAVVRQFNSRFWCPGTGGVDAFAQCWAGVNNWVLPPFGLYGKVLRFMREAACVGTMIVPRWTKQHWWPLICPDGSHFAPFVVDWLEFSPQQRVGLFLPGSVSAYSANGNAPAPFRAFALRLDFSQPTLCHGSVPCAPPVPSLPRIGGGASGVPCPGQPQRFL